MLEGQKLQQGTDHKSVTFTAFALSDWDQWFRVQPVPQPCCRMTFQWYSPGHPAVLLWPVKPQGEANTNSRTRRINGQVDDLKTSKTTPTPLKKNQKKNKKTLFGILWDASSTEKSISDLFSAASCLRVCGSHPLFPVSGSKIFDTTSWEGLGLNCSNGDKGYLQLPADTSTTPRPKQQHWIE